MKWVPVARLRRMRRDEVAWRLAQAGRTAVQRATMRIHPPRWDRAGLSSALAAGVLDHQPRGHDGDSSAQAADCELVRRLRSRANGLSLGADSVWAMRTAILARWPQSAAEASARADRILDGEYNVLGYRGLRWGAPGCAVDWHLDPVHGRRPPLVFWADVPFLDPAVGDHKVIWELNRHQHWPQLGRALWLTGDVRYRRGIIQQLVDWLAANPPLVGINWSSMLEIGLRAISWMWTLQLLLAFPESDDDPLWLTDMLVALDRQLGHVERNLSLYFSPNTHLTGEALALYVVGTGLPELAAGPRWKETGRRILLAEVDRQVHPDGGHAERSTHYQRYTLDFYLLALLTAERDGDTATAARFRDAVGRLADFTRTMADDSGHLPVIGDDDGGMLWPIAGRSCNDVRDSLALAAVLLNRPDLAPWGLQEEVLWIAGPRALHQPHCLEGSERRCVPVPSRTFEDTGYVVARDGSGGHAVFDTGRHGYLNGGHAHADALAITLMLAGRPLLVDAGTSTYTMDPGLRDRLRSSMSHNTLTLDGRSQAVPAGPFHWRTRAEGRLHAWRHSEGFDWAEASHDGYAPLGHRRTLLRAGSGWLVADEVLGRGRTTADSHWLFDPAWTLTLDAQGRLRAVHFDGVEAWILFDGGDVLLAHGDEDSGLGWYAPVYGTLIPTWTVRTTRKDDAPYSMVTWLGTTRAGASATPALQRLDPASDGEGRVIGVRVSEGDFASVFLLRPGEAPARDSRGCAIGGYQTNARMLHYADAAGRLLVLDLVDASHAFALHDGWISVAACGPVADLHAVVADDLLELHASQPPPRLDIQGSAVPALRRIRLNHREVVPVRADRPDAVVIHGADWAAGPPSHHARVGSPAAPQTAGC